MVFINVLYLPVIEYSEWVYNEEEEEAIDFTSWTLFSLTCVCISMYNGNWQSFTQERSKTKRYRLGIQESGRNTNKWINRHIKIHFKTLEGGIASIVSWWLQLEGWEHWGTAFIIITCLIQIWTSRKAEVRKYNRFLHCFWIIGDVRYWGSSTGIRNESCGSSFTFWSRPCGIIYEY